VIFHRSKISIATFLLLYAATVAAIVSLQVFFLNQNGAATDIDMP